MKFKFYNAHGAVTEVDVRYYRGEVSSLNTELGQYDQPIKYKDAQMIYEKYWALDIEESTKRLNNNQSMPQGGLFPLFDNPYDGANRAMAKVMRELGPTCVIAVDKANDLTLRYTTEFDPSSMSNKSWK